jgi:hypothetical protein
MTHEYFQLRSRATGGVLLWDGAAITEAREVLASAREGLFPDAVIVREVWNGTGEYMLHTEVMLNA